MRAATTTTTTKTTTTPTTAASPRRWAGMGLLLLLACGCTAVLMSLGSMCGTRPYATELKHRNEDGDGATPARANVHEGTTANVSLPLQLPSSASQSPPQPPPPFEWVQNEYTDYCYYVEDICRTSHRWFYRRRPRPHSAHHSTGELRQPELDWDTFHKDEWPENEETVYRRHYIFERHPLDDGGQNATTESAYFDADECATSPVENHLVLYGEYSDMLGEFYDKSLVFLDSLQETQKWVMDAQLYLHLFIPYKPLMDSHHLFTSPWRSRPLLSAVELWDDARCQCLPRLILCGYDITVTGAADAAVEGADAAATTATLDPNINTTGVDKVLVRAGGGWDSRFKTRYNSDRFRKLRDRLRATLLEGNKHVQEDVLEFRNQQFDRLNVPAEDRSQFRLVGLAQRSGRRRWRDLGQLQRSVQSQFLEKRVALVEINVEVDSSRYQQLVRHAALDGLIGIHGAQLTEAVWMRDGSWVVELLPFVPDYVYMGHWTRTVHHPTPVGILFHRTGLNHAGYRIPIDLTPYCNHDVSDEACWRGNRWDGRDFTLDVATLSKMLDAFFPFSIASAAPPAAGTADVVANANATATAAAVPLCSDLQERSNGTFVLYNVHCADMPGGPSVLLHDYWPCTSKCEVRRRRRR